MITTGKLTLTATCLLLTALISTSCKHLNYETYQGSGAVQGTGGTMHNVDGMDIWNNGTPNRRYTILGVTKQDRPRRDRRDERFDRELVKLARAHGGNALIIVSEDQERAGLLRKQRDLTVQIIRYEPSTFKAEAGNLAEAGAAENTFGLDAMPCLNGPCC